MNANYISLFDPAASFDFAQDDSSGWSKQKVMKQGWVYILKCADGSYYTGSTSDLDQRIDQHETGFYSGYTSKRRPVKLVWSDEFPDMNQAITIERQIKGWTRKKKEALIRGDFTLLHELAECKNESHYKPQTIKKSEPR